MWVCDTSRYTSTQVQKAVAKRCRLFEIEFFHRFPHEPFEHGLRRLGGGGSGSVGGAVEDGFLRQAGGRRLATSLRMLRGVMPYS